MYLKTLVLIYIILHNALEVSSMAIKKNENNSPTNDQLLMSTIIRWLVKIQYEKDTLQILVNNIVSISYNFYILKHFFSFNRNIS